MKRRWGSGVAAVAGIATLTLLVGPAGAQDVTISLGEERR